MTSTQTNGRELARRLRERSDAATPGYDDRTYQRLLDYIDANWDSVGRKIIIEQDKNNIEFITVVRYRHRLEEDGFAVQHSGLGYRKPDRAYTITLLGEQTALGRP